MGDFAAQPQFISEPTIPISLPPLTGESAWSYSNRLADVHGYPTAASFKVALGLAANFGPHSSHGDWRVLAQVTGFPVDVFAEMRRHARPEPARRRWEGLLGNPLSPAHIDKARIKVCPRCLAEDGYGRDFWSVSYALACPRHSTLLVDTCPRCGQLLRPARLSASNGCACGASLSQAPAASADAAIVAATATMALAAGAERAVGEPEAVNRVALPEPFRQLALGELLDCLHRLGSIALAKLSCHSSLRRRSGSLLPHLLTSREVPGLELAERRAILAAGTSILQDWPAGLWRTLDGLRGKFRDEQSSDPMAREFGTIHNALVAVPPRSADGRPVFAVWNAARAYKAERYAASLKTRITTTDPVARRLSNRLRAVDLAVEYGIGLAYARRVYRQVLTDVGPMTVEASEDDLSAEFRVRFGRLLGQAESSLGQADASAVLLGPGAKVNPKKLRAPDLLTPLPELRGVKFGVRYDRAQVLDLLGRLRQNARLVESLDGLVALSCPRALQRLAKQGYGIAGLLRDMLSGRLAYFTAVAQPRFVDFHVDLADAHAAVRETARLCQILSARFIAPRELNMLLGSAFGPGVTFTRSMSKELRATGQVPWCRDGSTVFFQLADLLAWADERLAPLGRTVRACLPWPGEFLAGKPPVRLLNAKAQRPKAAVRRKVIL